MVACLRAFGAAFIYKEIINARRIQVLKHGKRTLVSGSEIARLSRIEDARDALREELKLAKLEPSLTTSYRLLDSRSIPETRTTTQQGAYV